MNGKKELQKKELQKKAALERRLNEKEALIARMSTSANSSRLAINASSNPSIKTETYLNDDTITQENKNLSKQ